MDLKHWRAADRLAPGLAAAAVVVAAWALVADGWAPDGGVAGRWATTILAGGITILGGLIVAMSHRAHRERRTLALRVAAARGRAQVAERARGRALGAISAEFRTPLNAIMVFAELLTKGFVDGSARKRAEYAASIFLSGQQLLEKIDALLDQARLEAGELHLHHEEVDPKRLLDIVIRLVEPDARLNGVIVEMPAGAAPFVLLADSRRLKHVFATILGNAIRLTRRDGHVSIELRGRRDGGAEIVLAHTGTGMTEDELALALDPAGHADGAVVQIRESGWRGLWLARSLVELHGGTLTVRSAPTAGTMIALSFPRERVAPRQSAAALAAD